ncbi:MAG: hypothetical protein CMB13_05995 [Euryarchaeota archaeon]|nr:hypothetical protein [Euryarchaeota archaeon]
MHSDGGHLIDGVARGSMASGRRQALFGVLLMLSLSLAPVVSAAAEINLSSNSMAQEASPDEAAEYTITVRNTGSDDVTVQLSTTQGQDCQGFTSNIEQISETISSGSSATATLTVTVAQGADGDCETTVTGTANAAPPAPPGQPGQDDITVTTTAGEGGNGLFGVSLSTSQPQKTYSSGDEIDWSVTVENTGQNSAQVSLTMDEDSSCDSDELSATVDPSTVTLQSEGDTEDVIVTVSIPGGSSTGAGSHCFILRAEVTNDQNPSGRASDNLSLTLTIPERKECSASISPSSLEITPGNTVSVTFTVQNEGNTDWSVSTDTSGAFQDWASNQDTSSALLPQGQQRTFTFDIAPDDSIEAGDSTQITFKGMDGTAMKCSTELTVQLGQSHDASLSVATSILSNVDPGTAGVNSVNVRNLGNGPDILSLGAMMNYVDGSGTPNGWTVQFASPSVSLSSRHSNSGDIEAVEVLVGVPDNARADKAVEVTVTVTSNGASNAGVLATGSFEVRVAMFHEVSVTTIVGDGEVMQQTGAAGQIVRFPMTVNNQGNVEDNFLLEICDGGVPGDCVTPAWSTRFTDMQGNRITQITIQPDESAEIELQVTVSSTAFEFEDAEFRANVYVQAQTSTMTSSDFRVQVSNFDYAANIAFVNPGDDPDTMDLSLAPGSSTSFDIMVTNAGNSSFVDEAIVNAFGMAGLIDVTLRMNSSQLSDAFSIGAAGSEPVLITVDLSLTELALDGDYGTITIEAASVNDAAEISVLNILISVTTIYELDVTVASGTELEVNPPNSAVFELEVTNIGNAEAECIVNMSEALRGWSLSHNADESFKLQPGESIIVLVKASPPVGLIDEDTFSFVVRIEPVESAIDGTPVDLKAIGSQQTLMDRIGLDEQQQQYVQFGGAGIIVLLFVGMIMRAALQNRRYSKEFESDDS